MGGVGVAIGPDVVDVLVEDHRQIEELLQQAAQRDDPAVVDDGGRLVSVCIAELARHFTVEEEYVYPVVRELVPRGDRLAGDALVHNREAEVVMKRLERCPADSPDCLPLITDLLGRLHEHTVETEAGMFPALRRRCAPDQLDHLAGVVEMAKRTAPTHAHPGVPHNPPWNQILTPGVGLVDRVRDAFTGRPTTPEQM